MNNQSKSINLKANLEVANDNIGITQSSGLDINAIYNPEPYQNIIGALIHRDHKGVNTCYVNQDKCIINDSTSNRNLVRRLTPLECERLQGFPDGWTDIPKASDSPRYKALGNSVAIPCVNYVMKNIMLAYRQEMEKT